MMELIHKTYIEFVVSGKRYSKNGRLHREDGPAVVYPGQHREWWINGRRHREDGPALIAFDGFAEWWFNGFPYSKEDFFEKLNRKQQERLLFNSEFMGQAVCRC